MLDIGKELKESRISKGLSLKEISEFTRINLKYLEYLEQNNFTFLPEVYVRSFLKNYVKALEEDEKKFLTALDEILHPSQKKLHEEQEDEKKEEEASKIETAQFKQRGFRIGKSNLVTPKNIIFLITVMVIIVLLIILLINQGSDKEEIAPVSNEEEMYSVKVQEKMENFDNIAASDSLVLGITAKDSVWIQVKIDNSIVEEIYLRNGDSKKFKGKNDFQLLVGNAGGIVLYLNETQLPFTGVKGSVRRLKIDKNGIQLIQVKNEPKKP